MADPTPPVAPPLVTPGKETSEYSITKFLMWLGSGLSVLAAVNQTIEIVTGALKGVPVGLTGPTMWLAVVAALIAVAPAIYYKWTRLSLKTTAIEAAAAASASDAKAAIDAS